MINDFYLGQKCFINTMEGGSFEREEIYIKLYHRYD